MSYRAVLFDLGGVVFPSPFEAFDSYGREEGLPDGFVRGVIRRSSEEGAWAALERGELDEARFHAALEAEAEAAGHAIDAHRLMAHVARGFGPRPEMLRAIGVIRTAGLRTGALTNNWVTASGTGSTTGFLDGASLFDVVVESAVEGLRKPDPRVYELALRRLGVAAAETVFLDDLGINLKPARALGMTTIKVVEPAAALAELGAALGLDLA